MHALEFLNSHSYDKMSVYIAIVISNKLKTIYIFRLIHSKLTKWLLCI